ncbi:MAG: hypothetical protein GY789_21290 [Hyphomicrobiales bacterium]|nr:hypothetical protein [Hyphomicrobiales bacterium]
MFCSHAVISFCRKCFTVWSKVSKIIAAASICYLFVFLHFDANAEGMMTREDLQSDIAEAYDLLKKYHPNLTVHTSQAELDSIYNRILDSLDEQNSIGDAYLALTELFGAVCDEHTKVFMNSSNQSNTPGGWPWFEYPLFVIGKKLYLENKNRKEEIVSIGEISGSVIASELRKRHPSDGCLDENPLFVSERLEINSGIIGSLIGQSGPHIVYTKHTHSGLKDVRILNEANPTARTRRFHQLNKERSVAVEKNLLLAGFLREYLGPETVHAGLDYRYSAPLNIAYLGIRIFNNNVDTAAGIELVMRDIIAEKKPDAVVIDLTDNPGGWTRNARLLMAFLVPSAHRFYDEIRIKDVSGSQRPDFEYFDLEDENAHKREIAYFRTINPDGGVRTSKSRKRSFGKPDYKGQIVVLLSPASRSNAIRLALNLKRLRNAMLVGAVTATDTTTYCAGARGSFSLKNTGFKLQFPEICYWNGEKQHGSDNRLALDILLDILDIPFTNLNASILNAALGEFNRLRAD